MRNIKVGFKGKKFDVKVRELSLPEQGLGLMFRTKNCDNLLFDRRGRWAIHSWFVFFKFLALWLDEKNNVVEWKIVSPFKKYVVPKNDFARLIEVPINARNKKIIDIFKNG